MPSYNKKDFKESNVNYLNKDFPEFKESLVNYAQSYFPNTYKDFNETSPGMMLIEMSAYVGDVLSFYIDQQYKEMLLPLAEERRNLINMAKMFGYKVKPIVPSFVELIFTSELVSVIGDESKVDYGNSSNGGGVFDRGIQVKSNSNSSLIFETLDVVDFTISQSADTSSPAGTNSSTDLINSYTLSRTVRAVSGETKTTSFTINAPEKFRKLILPETNIIDILSCVDTNGNTWYEVDFLAKDKVPIPLHYASDEGRTSAYSTLNNNTYESDVPVPYSLEYIKTSKRFTRETNEDNTTSLVFGNGILRNGTILDDGLLDLEQMGITIPGQSNDLEAAIDPLLGDEYSTLGETPMQTTLTITYRVGGGIDSNATSGDLTELVGTPLKVGGATAAQISNVTNDSPARGGKDEETIDEIREKTKSFFATQNRCVTKEDYEARIMNLPSKFGNIAKVYVARNAGYSEDTMEYPIENINTIHGAYTSYATDIPSLTIDLSSDVESIDNKRITAHDKLITARNHIHTESVMKETIDTILTLIGEAEDLGQAEITFSISSSAGTDASSADVGIKDMVTTINDNRLSASLISQTAVEDLTSIGGNITHANAEIGNINVIQAEMLGTNNELINEVATIQDFHLTTSNFKLPSVTIYILAYDSSKKLVGNPNSAVTETSDDVPQLIKQNIKTYLDNFRILTDDVTIQDGYVINFGVFFDVVAHKYANKQQVKLLCIQKIINYFKIDKMQFSQPIFISQLEYELMGVDGVRAVNYVRLSQHENKEIVDMVEQVLGVLPEKTFNYSITADGTINMDGTSGYGYAYNFKNALVDGVILPPSPENPGIFELKNPNQNIKGVVK